jgi:hypothetical protein
VLSVATILINLRLQCVNGCDQIGDAPTTSQEARLLSTLICKSAAYQDFFTL